MTTSENRGPIDFQPSRELYPFASRWFESSVGPLHYVDEGDGPPILLLHGNPTWSFLYRDLIGCTVSEQGRAVGRVAKVFEAGAGDVLVIEHEKREMMVPLVDQWVDRVDVEAREIHLVAGATDAFVFE